MHQQIQGKHRRPLSNCLHAAWCETAALLSAVQYRMVTLLLGCFTISRLAPGGTRPTGPGRARQCVGLLYRMHARILSRHLGLVGRCTESHSFPLTVQTPTHVLASLVRCCSSYVCAELEPRRDRPVDLEGRAGSIQPLVCRDGECVRARRQVDMMCLPPLI